MRREDRLAGKTIFIVGGSSGIGLATARIAADTGAVVHIAARSTSSLDDAATKLPSTITRHVCDAMSEADVDAMFGTVDMIDHVFVTAGRFAPDDICMTPIDELRAIHDSRLWSCVNVARRAAPHMAAGGSMIFMSGTAASRPEGAALASASCGAVQSLARSLAVSLAPVRFNALCPGYTRTPLWQAAFGDQADAILESLRAKIPLRRVAQPDEIADAAIFLMTNTFINGVELVIDGGARLI